MLVSDVGVEEMLLVLTSVRGGNHDGELQTDSSGDGRYWLVSLFQVTNRAKYLVEFPDINF